MIPWSVGKKQDDLQGEKKMHAGLTETGARSSSINATAASTLS